MPAIVVVYDGSVPAASELQRAIAIELAAFGMRVVLASHREDALATMIAGIAEEERPRHVVGDLFEGARCAEAAFGAPDFLVTITVHGAVDIRWRTGSMFCVHNADPAVFAQQVAASLKSAHGNLAVESTKLRR